MRKRSEVAKSEAAKSEAKPEPKAPESAPALTNEEAADAFDFDHANRPAAQPLRPDLDRIVETVFIEDMHETWKKLEAGLRVGEKRSEHGALNKASDEAETNARLAHRLYVTAEIAKEEWEKTNDVIFGAMWNEAYRALQQEKDQGIRSKQITDGDIRAKCATLFPDEWKTQEIKRARVKATVDTLKNLSEVWLKRCGTLQTMLGKSR